MYPRRLRHLNVQAETVLNLRACHKTTETVSGLKCFILSLVAGADAIRTRFQKLAPFLDERMRRLVAASESLTIGFGGTSEVSRQTGVSRRAIIQGIKELDEAPGVRVVRVRRAGGGRKKTVDKDASLKTDLERLVDPSPGAIPSRRCAGRARACASWLKNCVGMGHQTSHRMVAELLHELGYSLQANRKTLEGSSHADRDAAVRTHQPEVEPQLLGQRQPVISVDTKKKELVGDFKNSGRELRPRGDPEKVRVHDFVIPELGRAAPYGVYDLANNSGWVSVGSGSRHGSFRRRDDSPLVALHGAGIVPAGIRTSDHRRFRRQ